MYRQNPTREGLIKLFRANEALAAEREIQAYRARNAEEMLALEKKKRQRGKRLGLTGKAVTGAQFFGPDEIQEARDYLANKERKLQEERERKETEKIEKAVQKRLEKEREKERRANQRAIDTQIRKDVTAQGRKDTAAAKLAIKIAKKAVSKSTKSHIVILKVRSNILRKLDLNQEVILPIRADPGEGVLRQTKSGRITTLPAHFKKKK